MKTASYELELSAVDALGSVRAVEYAIPTAAVAVYLAQGGTAVGVGKYAEHDKAVDIAPDWDVWFRGKRLLDAVWPVGSIYLSASEISPETLFGGTWEQVKDRFLLAAGIPIPGQYRRPGGAYADGAGASQPRTWVYLYRPKQHHRHRSYPAGEPGRHGQCLYR